MYGVAGITLMTGPETDFIRPGRPDMVSSSGSAMPMRLATACSLRRESLKNELLDYYSANIKIWETHSSALMPARSMLTFWKLKGAD